MIKHTLRFFDKLEDNVRSHLSRSPIVYALIAGFAMVLFWRSVWHLADMFASGMTINEMMWKSVEILETQGVFIFLLYEPVSILWVILLLLITGLFVSFFIGDRIIISGMKHEKKIEEKTVDELTKEETEIQHLTDKVNKISKDIEEIKNVLLSK